MNDVLKTIYAGGEHLHDYGGHLMGNRVHSAHAAVTELVVAVKALIEVIGTDEEWDAERRVRKALAGMEPPSQPEAK